MSTRAIAATITTFLAACGGGAKTPQARQTPQTTQAPETPQAPPAKPIEKPAAPVIPDTPAGKVLSGWLEVFNSGDEARMRAFATEHKAPRIVDMQFRQMTGGFDLLRAPAGLVLSRVQQRAP